MNPPFAMIQQLAQYREDEIRRSVNQQEIHPARQSRPQGRFATSLSTVFQKRAPAHNYDVVCAAEQVIQRVA